MDKLQKILSNCAPLIYYPDLIQELKVKTKCRNTDQLHSFITDIGCDISFIYRFIYFFDYDKELSNITKTLSVIGKYNFGIIFTIPCNYGNGNGISNIYNVREVAYIKVPNKEELLKRIKLKVFT